MMPLEQILTLGRCKAQVPGGSKKKVLEYIADLVAKSSHIDENSLLESLSSRERLGSTGFGNGIAIPHCRHPDCTTPLGALIQLQTPIDFDALDAAPVDLLFVLLVPLNATDEHLELLRQIATIFDHSGVREDLRAANSDEELYQQFINCIPLLRSQ